MPKCEQCGNPYKAKDACYIKIIPPYGGLAKIVKVCPNCKGIKR